MRAFVIAARRYRNDWDIIGSMAINSTFGQARDLIASGRVDVRPLLTGITGLGDVGAILGRAKAPGELKVMVAPTAGSTRLR